LRWKYDGKRQVSNVEWRMNVNGNGSPKSRTCFGASTAEPPKQVRDFGWLVGWLRQL